MKRGLDALFAKQEASRKAAVQAQKTEEEYEAAALRRFVELRDKIIRPAMEAMGNYLKKKGYASQIVVEDEGIKERRDTQPLLVPSSIRMNLGPAALAPTGLIPHLTVTCDKSDGRVAFSYGTFSGRSGGGESGSAGEADLSEVTEDLILKKLMMVIEKIVR
jgi:hypothetical protein